MKIIAEVGSNWATIDDCKKSIALAKSCGADAVKFQLFDYESLYGIKQKFDDTLVREELERNTGTFFSEDPSKKFNKHCLPKEWLPILKEKADAFGVEFMCSAFSPELLDVVNPFVKTHKLASSELTHVRMLEKLNSFKKPVIISTGGHGEYDIRRALNYLEDCEVTILYCVSEYPARRVELYRIEQLKDLYFKDVGFSDHTIDVNVVPIHAMGMGATVIEKHVNFVGAKGPDADYALNQEDFKAMCDAIHGFGTSKSSEIDMVLKHNRRLIAIKDINEGDSFTEGENFGIYRSLKNESVALSPWAVDMVNGQRAKCKINSGDGIYLDAIET